MDSFIRFVGSLIMAASGLFCLISGPGREIRIVGVVLLLAGSVSAAQFYYLHKEEDL